MTDFYFRATGREAAEIMARQLASGRKLLSRLQRETDIPAAREAKLRWTLECWAAFRDAFRDHEVAMAYNKAGSSAKAQQDELPMLREVIERQCAYLQGLVTELLRHGYQSQSA